MSAVNQVWSAPKKSVGPIILSYIVPYFFSTVRSPSLIKALQDNNLSERLAKYRSLNVIFNLEGTKLKYPGGKCFDNETPEAAAVRLFAEQWLYPTRNDNKTLLLTLADLKSICPTHYSRKLSYNGDEFELHLFPIDLNQFFRDDLEIEENLIRNHLKLAKEPMLKRYNPITANYIKGTHEKTPEEFVCNRLVKVKLHKLDEIIGKMEGNCVNLVKGIIPDTDVTFSTWTIYGITTVKAILKEPSQSRKERELLEKNDINDILEEESDLAL